MIWNLEVAHYSKNSRLVPFNFDCKSEFIRAVKEIVMKIDITGASHFVNRMFEACGKFQWAREFLQNSIEARATRIHFGIEWNAVRNAGVYRRTIIDDGLGMSPDELLGFFSTLGAGAKKIGGLHENYGVGSKVATLPWNCYGMVVISYKDNHGSMIWIRLDKNTGEYELVDFATDQGIVNVIEPEDCSDIPGEWCDWSRVRPDWLHDHGTIIVLLGDRPDYDTIQGNPNGEEGDIKGLSRYLNARFWDLSAVKVTVAEPRNSLKIQWPKSEDDRDDATRVNTREIKGACHWIVSPSKEGKISASGTAPLREGRVPTHWFLWDGERPRIHSYAQKNGYIAIKYKNELFELTNSLNDFRSFGILEQAVRRNLNIILEPQLLSATGDSRWGVHPDQSRNRLIFTGDELTGSAIPLAEWGVEFANSLPDAILAAIKSARDEGTGSISDDEYRKRLMERFGERWSIKRHVTMKQPREGADPVVESSGNLTVFSGRGGRETGGASPGPRKAIRKAATYNLNGNRIGESTEALLDIPRYRFARADDFESPFHLAAWAPNDPEGPTVLINIESPLLQSVIDYHLAYYPPHFAEEVSKTIREVYGEVAVAKVAHLQKLAEHINTHELDKLYRSEQALTSGLMGLIAEESLLNQRLARFRLGNKSLKISAVV